MPPPRLEPWPFRPQSIDPRARPPAAADLVQGARYKQERMKKREIENLKKERSRLHGGGGVKPEPDATDPLAAQSEVVGS